MACIGGHPGNRGRNFLIYACGKTVNLGGKTSVNVGAGVGDHDFRGKRDRSLLMRGGGLAGSGCGPQFLK